MIKSVGFRWRVDYCSGSWMIDDRWSIEGGLIVYFLNFNCFRIKEYLVYVIRCILC